MCPTNLKIFLGNAVIWLHLTNLEKISQRWNTFQSRSFAKLCCVLFLDLVNLWRVLTVLYFGVSAVPELRSYLGISEDIRNRVDLKDRLFQLTAIFLNFKWALNLPLDIFIGSGEGHFTRQFIHPQCKNDAEGRGFLGKYVPLTLSPFSNLCCSSWEAGAE